MKERESLSLSLMVYFGRVWLCFAMVLMTTAPTPFAADAQQVENLRAFAKLYGYVRFFHPSDAAAEADWWAIANEGAARAAAAQTIEELELALETTFLPVAPTLIVEQTGKGTRPPASPRLKGYDPERIVAWQHRGCNLSEGPSIYQSIRTARPNQMAIPVDSTWWLDSSVGGIDLRSLEFRLRAAVRTIPGGSGGEARLYVGILDSDHRIGFWDSMDDRPINTYLWNTYEITGTVDDDALEIFFGGALVGSGAAWFDAFEFEVREPDGEWTPAQLLNPAFEQGTIDEPIFGWATSEDAGVLDDSDAFEGSQSLRIVSRSPGHFVRLFDALPGADDIILKDLGAGLRCELPIWLINPHDAPPYDRDFETKSTATTVTDQNSEHIAAVVITWTALQHFYPYFDVVDVDWDSELTGALEGALDSQSKDDNFKVLQHLIAALDDGHGSVISLGGTTIGWLPIQCDWVENHVVITAAAEYFEIGDILLSIDGIPVEERLEELLRSVSGSPQRKLRSALYQIGTGESLSTASVEVERNGEQIEVSAPRRSYAVPAEPRPQPIAVLDEGIYYVDLSRASMGSIAEVIDTLADADGVVFDLRGYPANNATVLSHLTDVPLRSARWNVAQIIYPDQENISGWDTSGRWYVEPRKPRFRGSIVFLTDARAISYAESVMGIVEHYHLGEIVGRPTAGANGNSTGFQILNDYRIRWTGMKVLKHDGSQHHIIGNLPTVPVARTIAAIREGRDEDIEKAVELIRAGR